MLLDVLLLLLAAAVTTAGIRSGLIGSGGHSTRFFTATGVALITIGLLWPRIARLGAMSDTRMISFTLTVIGSGVVVGLLIGAFLGPGLARRIHRPEGSALSRRLDSWTGGVVALLLLLAALWLTYPALRALDGPVGNQANDSLVLAAVDGVTLAPLGIVSGVTTLVDRFPSAFDLASRPPERGVPPPDSGLDAELRASVARQVVRVTGVACSRPTEGTGFALGSGLVLTNAHVVAGQPRTAVHLGGIEYVVTVIGFDPARDLALLELPGDAPAGPGLTIDSGGVGAIGGVFGHPAGQDLRVAPFQISDRVTGTGLDIYGEGDVRRKVYFLSADLSSGDSGAPLVDTDGQVVGIVFAISPDEPLVAFALTSAEIEGFLAEDHQGTVGPTECR
ncbi:MAG: trypsin-like peptidase domain-containing protein [Actinomycetia bacterium]|nr:trypsin-like peptidase domain-containing protein [Actinomycetes bacterium]